MRILHLLSQRPDATGSGVTLQHFVRSAYRHRIDSHLLAGVPLNFETPSTIQSFSEFSTVRFEEDLPFVIPGMSDAMPYPSIRFRDLSSRQLDQYISIFRDRLEHLQTIFQPDVIHSHHLWVLTSIATDVFKSIPVFSSSHGSDLRQFVNCPNIAEMILPKLRNVTGVFALTQAQKREIELLYGIPAERIHVVGAGYDDTIFTPLPDKTIRSASHEQPRPPRLLYAGKYSKAKGVPWLFDALNILAEHPWELHLAGGGEGREYDEIIQRALSMPGRIFDHGLLGQQSLADLMRICDVFILPSFYEGLPLVLLEALACGCRIVATGLPGVKELFGNLPAHIVRIVPVPRLMNSDQPVESDLPGFVSNIAAAIADLIRSQHAPEDSDDIACLLNRYTWAEVFKRVYSHYCRVTRGNPPQSPDFAESD
ncbi:glycosyltransferase [bacterium]|nr:glycosyltransferase [candidate division CSSED10-310 bacterium]